MGGTEALTLAGTAFGVWFAGYGFARMMGAHGAYIRISRNLFLNPLVNLMRRHQKFVWGFGFGAIAGAAIALS